MNPATTRTVFRTLAIAEAASWAILLVAMFCKWILESEPFGLEEGGVPKGGMLHGIVFVLYVVAALVAARTFRWSPRTTVLALAASIPPLFTIWFETWADRTGRLSEPVPAGRL
ncbi:MAG: DUF3817 domain-containing protein [Aeromicrobium sp.]